MSHEEAADASACRPHPIPGSDSQGNSDPRKITRNLSLTFAAFRDPGQQEPDKCTDWRAPVQNPYGNHAETIQAVVVRHPATDSYLLRHVLNNLCMSQ